MELLDPIIFVCFAVVVIGLLFFILEGIFRLINYFTKGEFENKIIDFFDGNDDDE